MSRSLLVTTRNQTISLVISDVDATLITPDNVITESAKQAVRNLPHERTFPSREHKSLDEIVGQFLGKNGLTINRACERNTRMTVSTFAPQ